MTCVLDPLGAILDEATDKSDTDMKTNGIITKDENIIKLLILWKDPLSSPHIAYTCSLPKHLYFTMVKTVKDLKRRISAEYNSTFKHTNIRISHYGITLEDDELIINYNTDKYISAELTN
jgi:hypothetical protein